MTNHIDLFTQGIESKLNQAELYSRRGETAKAHATLQRGVIEPLGSEFSKLDSSRKQYVASIIPRLEQIRDYINSDESFQFATDLKLVKRIVDSAA